MKTSNIILLSLLLFILLVVTTSIIYVRVNLKEKRKIGHHSLNEKVLHPNLPSFNKLEVDGKFQVYYTQGKPQSVAIEIDSILLSSITTEVVDGKLTLKANDDIFDDTNVSVTITTDSINELTLSAGGSFETNGSMQVCNFRERGSAGAIFKANGNYNDLSVDISAGSISTIDGKTDNLFIEASAGSIFNGNGLIAQKGNISASSGAILKINVIGELGVEASSGSIVNYEGNPKLKSINISSGAQFSK